MEQKILSEYQQFTDEMRIRIQKLGANLVDFPIDHVCYRAKTLEEHAQLLPLFTSMSVLYTRKFFHERYFYAFFLREPLNSAGLATYMLEFAQPGGSDSYETGFQHLEILTPLPYHKIFTKEQDLKELLFQGKYAEEESYLKWSDKKVLKLKRKPIAFESLAEDNSEIILV